MTALAGDPLTSLCFGLGTFVKQWWDQQSVRHVSSAGANDLAPKLALSVGFTRDRLRIAVFPATQIPARAFLFHDSVDFGPIGRQNSVKCLGYFVVYSAVLLFTFSSVIDSIVGLMTSARSIAWRQSPHLGHAIFKSCLRIFSTSK